MTIQDNTRTMIRSVSNTTWLGRFGLHEQTLEGQQRRWGWVFLAPWLIGFTVFSLFPMVASLVFSFTDFQVGQPIHWIGLENWQKLFSDPVTLNSLIVTLRFAILIIPILTIVPMGIAALLTSKLVMGKPILRVLFYMPYVVPTISSIFVWSGFLNGQSGWLNRMLRSFGVINVPNWLFDNRYIQIGMMMISLWGIGNAMLTMMISIQNIPTELYEAGTIDGASRFELFRYITLPLFSPMIFYNLILSVIGLMQYFVVPWVLSLINNSAGGFSNASINFININLYRTAFLFAQMGYASAQAWFMFIIAMGLTIILFATSRNWVYYTNND